VDYERGQWAARLWRSAAIADIIPKMTELEGTAAAGRRG
jgi:hypothetical protein